MLLPVFSILAVCGYVMFNKNAKDSYSGTYEYINTMKLSTYSNSENISDEEFTVNSVIMHKLYGSQFTGNTFTLANYNLGPYDFAVNSCIIFNVDSLYVDDVLYPDCKSIVIGKVNYQYGISAVWLFNNIYSDNLYTYYPYNSNVSYCDDLGNVVYNSVQRFDISNNGHFIRRNLVFNNSSNIVYYMNSMNALSILEKNVFYTDFTLSSAFYYALDSLNTTPVFSWAKDSFVKEPFTYITGLFGVQSDSPINTMFSYWASVSICWLVFDLLMYVPLLAHRWIDKGIVE